MGEVIRAWTNAFDHPAFHFIVRDPRTRIREIPSQPSTQLSVVADLSLDGLELEGQGISENAHAGSSQQIVPTHSVPRGKMVIVAQVVPLVGIEPTLPRLSGACSHRFIRPAL